MTIYGYSRVSTLEQSHGRQFKALEDYGVDKLFTEKISGAKKNRPEFDKMIKKLKEGDVVVVSELTRLSRSTSQLFKIAEDFQARGVQLVSIKEKIDSTSTTGRLMFGMLSVLAQFEREIIVERTKEGLAVAKANGVKMGRPKVDPDRMDLAVELYEGGNYIVSDIVRKTGISKATLYRELRNRGLV